MKKTKSTKKKKNILKFFFDIFVNSFELII